jgi:outer membrane protein assembly factor BamD (BamD/ComL family)
MNLGSPIRLTRTALASLLILTGMMQACKSPDTAAQIESLEADFQRLEEAPPDSAARMRQVAMQLAALYEAFADEHPKDPRTPAYLMKSASHYLMDQASPAKPIEVCDRVIREFPDSPEAAEALFQKAFIYNNTLRSLDQAKTAYEEFLRRYPEHPLSASAESELATLGMTEEQLLRRLLGDSLRQEEVPAE